ncbi:hypothetical protein FFLO_04800 [Filobasidium floriforme]|uniref:Chromatin modification-related protein EAF6 n=1 Tax=Filobasidium floriforme TaxID=5210 RepID=A0A8K0JIT3_9TREE|nr:histone acetyltransferase subunit NuA4-domain-containing protein [Filobasidium floriforme]KAG7530821.1 hypothetical protein FFLO_04800 [Filobasidium floriforme]KAH8090474.1 histone acetyltransferase subunit NuA4-domain-containing protein [Filobasidium floriforme]
MSNPAEANRTALDRLKSAIKAKRLADESLAQMELSIANLESNYLRETSGTGNIIKGFENYLKPTAAQLQRRNHPVVNDDDRLFSGSSTTYELSMQLLQNKADEEARRAEQKQAALEAREAALAASGHEPVTGGQKKRKREREESVATGDGESVRPSGNRKKNRGGDDD